MSTVLDLALQWRKARAERLMKAAEVETLKEAEALLKKTLIERLGKLANKAISNGERLIQLVTKDEPTVQPENWPLLYKHIQKTGEFELLERRLGRAAAKERIEAGEKIPGVSVIKVDTISDTKAKK